MTFLRGLKGHCREGEVTGREGEGRRTTGEDEGKVTDR